MNRRSGVLSVGWCAALLLAATACNSGGGSSSSPKGAQAPSPSSVSATPTPGLPGGGGSQTPGVTGQTTPPTASATVTQGGGGGGNTQAFCKDFITLYGSNGLMDAPTMTPQLLNQVRQVDAEAPASVRSDVDLWSKWLENPSASADGGVAANEAYARTLQWLPQHCSGVVVN